MAYSFYRLRVIQVSHWDESTTILADGTGCADTVSNPEATENLCTVSSYDALGRRASSTDVLGQVTEYAYDGLGRLITTTRYLDGQPVRTATAYDALGNRLAQTDPLTHTVTYQYDSLNRVLTTTTEMGVTSSQIYNAAGWVLTRSNGLGETTRTTHDTLGRRVAVTDGENNTTQYGYDALGNQVVITDAEGIRTTHLYDGLNRLQGVIENDVPGNSPSAEQDVLTQYLYDALGNRLVITNALGYTGSLTLYDELNRPIVITDAVGNSSYTQYNVLGSRVVMTDGNEAVTVYAYDGLNRLITTTYTSDNESVVYGYDAAGKRLTMQDSLGTTRYVYDDFNRLISVTNTFTGTLLYAYDPVGNRTHLTYPDGKVITNTYDGDNRLVQVADWDGGVTSYGYDGASRPLTTTLPNGVVSVNVYDGAGRLVELSHTAADDSLIARYEYVLDKVGNRTVVTETVLQPGMVPQAGTFLEENGLLVVEAENGERSAGSNAAWISQTVQTNHSGDAYVRALPDVGALLLGAEAESGPRVDFPVAVETTGTYAVWVRAMAPDGRGDSVHVGLDGEVVETADNLTGFAPNEWDWSRLTLDSGNATLDLSSSGAYTLGLFMREDGIRVDKLLLITDTNYIPTGSGPGESQQQVVTGTTSITPVVQVVTMAYDPLYRLQEADYSGLYTATFQYEYDALGNRLAYTKSLTTTEVTTYTYNAANQLMTAKLDSSSDTWHYVYDGNGNQVRQVPNGLTPANGETRYTFNQMNRLIQVESHNGSNYVIQAQVRYDGDGGRLQAVAYVGGTAITTTFTLDRLNGNLPLVTQNGIEVTHLLYGLFGLGQYQDDAWLYYLSDGQRTVRQLIKETGEITLFRTYDPFGGLLAIEGAGTSLFGFAGALEGAGGLLYVNGRYYDPATGRFLSPTNNFDPMHPSRGLNGYLASLLMANPGALLFPLLLWLNRRKNKKGIYKTDLFLLGLFLMVSISACQNQGPQQQENTPAPTSSEIDQGGTQPSSTPDPTSTSQSGGATSTPTPPFTPTPLPTAQNTSTLTPCPTDTPTPSVTPTLVPLLKSWEEDLLAQVIYSETSNGQYADKEGSRIAHVYINRVLSKAWDDMWAATRPPQSAIGVLWGENWTGNPKPIPTTLEDAQIKITDWKGRLNNTTNPLFADGWQKSKAAVGVAIQQRQSGYDPTSGSTWFVALGRTRNFDEGETQEAFEQRFWEDYNREVSQFSGYASQNPDFAWTITSEEDVVQLGNNTELIAIITGTHPCTYDMSCNP